MHMHIHTRVHVHTHVHMYTHVHVHTYTQHTHTQTHTHAHTYLDIKHIAQVCTVDSLCWYKFGLCIITMFIVAIDNNNDMSTAWCYQYA